jgi:ketosteroid isomerase-like protein
MSKPVTYASPDDVEQSFYQLVARGDADLLMQVWSDEEESLCVHPTGIRLLGLAPICDSWRSIFATTTLRVQAETVARWQGGMLAIHHLTEILFVGDDPNPHGPLYVTHVYGRGAHGWRLLSRHASAADDRHQARVESSSLTLH